MGCCASTYKTSPPPEPPHFSGSGGSKSPPPTYPLIEEENVKEILSETPTITTFHENHQDKIQFLRAVDFSGIAGEKKRHQNGAVLKKPFSESARVPTIITKKKQNNGGFNELRRRSPTRFGNRLVSGEMEREKTVSKYSGRRSEHLPGRNRPGPGTGRRRESLERRPRLSALRTNTGPGSSATKTDRVGSGSGERIRKVDGGKERGENTWPPTSNELLENPLVSLECFIFL